MESGRKQPGGRRRSGGSRRPGGKRQPGGRKADRVRALSLAAALFFGLPGAGMPASGGQEETGAVSEYTLNDIYFDTVVSIRFDAGQNGEQLTDGCRSICEEAERTFSRTDENSELYAVNHRDEDRVEVSEMLAGVVQTGLDYYEISDGRFDITIAPVTDLWDFRSEAPSVPPEAMIQGALRKVDGSAVHVEEEDGAWYLAFDRPDTMIDLGALVKGWAADRLAEYLKENGVSSGLINLGGNVLALGAKTDGSAWKVGIQKPFEQDIVDVVEVTDQSVVTSGVYERCFEADGILYHHILDPATGYPVSGGLWGVSIISDSSLTGDAMSTVCLLLGKEEAMDLIRHTEGVRAVFVDDELHVTECE